MIKLLILFTFIVNLYSFDGVSEFANNQVQEEKHNQLLGTAIEDDITATTSDNAKNYETRIAKKEKDKISSNEPEYRSILQNTYFVDFFTFSDSSLYCPPLNPLMKGYQVMIDWTNPVTSEISCSVYKSPAYNPNKIVFEKLEKVHSKVFYNPIHHEKIKKSTTNEIESLINEDAIANSKDYSKRLALAKKAISFKYSSIGNEEYIDLSDALTAVMTFNPSVIDFQETFDSKSLVFHDNYFTTYTDPEVYSRAKDRKEFMNQAAKEINGMYDFFPNTIFEADVAKSIDDEKEDFVKIVDKKLNMLVYFLIKYNYIFTDIFYIFFMFVAAYGLYNLVNFTKESWTKAEEGKGKLQSLFNVNSVFFIISFSIIVTMTASTTGVSLEVKDENENKTHYVDLSFLQSSVLATLASEINYLTDELGLAVIDSYVSTRFSDTFVDASTINTIAMQNIRYKKVKEELIITNEYCLDIYDIEEFKTEKDWFSKHDYDKNPFIPEQYLNESRSSKSIGKFSLYNSAYTNGYVKDKVLLEEKKLSINSCYEARNKLNTINRKINFTNKRLDSFNDLQFQDLEFQKKQLMVEKIYDDYYKLGFIATAWLNVIEAYERISELPSKKFEQWSNLILEPDAKKLAGFAAENFVLMLAIGEPVQNLVSEVASIGTDSLLGWIPLFGEGLSSAASNITGYAAAIIWVDFIDEFIPAIRGLFLFLISNVMFILIFLAMFMTFWLVGFGVLYAFLQNSIEKFSRNLVKALISYVKSLILVFMIFITIFMMDLFNEYIYYSIDVMTKDLLSQDSSAFEFLAVHILKGVAKIFAVILEFILSYQLLVKGTSTATTFFEVNTNDISDVLTEGIANTIQQKVVK